MSPTLADRRPPLRVATRRSSLAQAQSRAVGERLSALSGRDLLLVHVTTRGDVDRAPLAEIGGVGVFVAAVRQAVVAGEADVAVHSLKDLPTTPDPRLRLAAVPPREDPRDALVSREGGSLAELPGGARVGTGSPRRRSQLVALRPDLELVDIRGNVDTRLARVRGGDGADLDAVVLAVAGLARLGRREEVTEALAPEQVMPAPGQGALAVEVPAEPTDDQRGGLEDALRTIDDANTRAEVTAERALLAALEAGCSAPVGALARTQGGQPPTLQLRAVLARADGSLVRRSCEGGLAEAAELGRRLAGEILQEAAGGPQERPGHAAGTNVVADTYHAHRGSSE